jgi:DNA-binding winged helix-turn-helix (wHTH) protein/Tol biopolymer transport system component
MSETYRFGPYRIEFETRTLSRDGESVQVTAKEFDILRAIVRRAPEPARRSAIVAEAWPGQVHVKDETLTRHVSSLRKKLRTTDGDAEYIGTISQEGYFIATPVVSMPESHSPSPISTDIESSGRGVPRFRSLPAASWRLLALTIAGVLSLGLVYSWNSKGDPRVVHYRPLSRDESIKAGPLVTDGRRIYFASLAEGKNVIRSVPVAGGDTQVVHIPPDSALLMAISTDGSSLLVASEDHQALYEFHLSSAAVRQIPLPSGLQVGKANWHPDGRTLAVSSQNDLWILDVSGRRPVRRFKLPGRLGRPQWNRSGDRLRVDVEDPISGRNLWWEMDTLQAMPHPVGSFATSGFEINGFWAQNGLDFIFQTFRQNEPGQSDLWFCDNFGAHRLTDGPLAWDSPAPGLTQGTILAIGTQTHGDLVYLDPPHARRRYALGALPGYEIDFCQDGQSLAFVRYPEHTIWRSNANGGFARQLTPPDIEAHQPHWSPDGTKIAFLGRRHDARGSRIFLVTTDRGRLEEPLPGGGPQGVPTWSPDGRYLYFGFTRDIVDPAQATIRQLDLRSGRVTVIPAPVPLWSPRMSPDGRSLSAIDYDSHVLYVRENASGTWSKLVEMDFIEEAVWSRDSSLIQFYGRNLPGPGALFRVATHAGRVEHVADLTNFQCLGARWFGIAPDGAPLGFQAANTQQIYALDWERK